MANTSSNGRRGPILDRGPRYLFYIAKYYKSCIKGKQLYQSKQIKLPSPEFVVFYNGKQDKRHSWTQKLSDAFEDGSKGFLEITVKWINVRKRPGSTILKASQPLNAYATLVEQVEKGKEAGMTLEVAIRRGLEYCIAHGFLSNFFEEYIEEVETVFAEEWNFDTALEVRAEEAREAGLAEGEARGRIDGRIAAIIENVRNMMDSLKWTAQAVMDAMKISPADRPAILAAL